MKTILRLTILLIISIALSARAGDVAKARVVDAMFDDTSRFIFYSILEGLYEDGLTNKDVDKILMSKEKQCYYHFIYACPICNATIWALEAYRGRPDQFYSVKSPGSTFGPGLSEELHEQLYSDIPRQRLGAINTLVRGWMDRRIKSMNLSDKDRAVLLEGLKKKRQEGMDALQSFRRHEHGPTFGVTEAAPAYVELEECAVCNAAVGRPMKLPDSKGK